MEKSKTEPEDSNGDSDRAARLKRRPWRTPELMDVDYRKTVSSEEFSSSSDAAVIYS